MSESKPFRVSRKIAQPRLGTEPATSAFPEQRSSDWATWSSREWLVLWYPSRKFWGRNKDITKTERCEGKLQPWNVDYNHVNELLFPLTKIQLKIMWTEIQLSLNLPLHEALTIETSHSETGLNKKYASLVKDKNRLRKYAISRTLVHAKDNCFPVLRKKKKGDKVKEKESVAFL